MSDREADERSGSDIAVSLETPRFLRPWRFVASVPTMAALPPEGPVEIAFAGRSNVGKSSLLNALVGRKGLARASNTPGRTQALNFFVEEASGDRPEIALVDMPGYGYAEAPKAQVDAWNRLVRDYLRGRVTLKRVYVLIDARHGLKANDGEVLDLLDASAVSYALVLTKGDKVKPAALARVADETRAAIARRPAAFPDLIVTSAERNVGIDDLRAAVEQVIGDATRPT